MRKILLLALFFSGLLIYAQTVPPGINYQAVIRNNTGAIATNSFVTLKFAFFNSSSLSTVVYNETHILHTGPMGIVTCTIGMGSVGLGSFSNIAWNNGDVWYDTKIDMGNTGTFVALGNTQKFMTVPYAFYAEKTVPPTYSISQVTGGNNLWSAGSNTVFIPATISTSNSSTSSTITSSGVAVVTPTIGNLFNINVPAPTLTISTTNILKLTQGTTSSTVLLPATNSNSITMIGLGNISISPTTPSTLFTVNVPHYTAGSGISITGNVITNAAPIGVSSWSLTGNKLYPTALSNLVGIGTNAPNNKLTVTNTVTSNSALFAETSGSVAAISAKSTNTFNPLALEVEGHIKSIGAAPTVSVINNSLINYSAAITASLNTLYNNNDVSGNIDIGFSTPINSIQSSINIPNTPPWIYSYFVVRVTYDKIYQKIPKVLLTPVLSGPFQTFDVSLLNSTKNYFDVLFNFSIVSTNAISNTSFNYFVIE